MVDDNIFRSILRKYWGYPDFRPVQLDIIRSIYEGKDVLGLLPTGGGKSITFQVPALTMDGVCLVVTPLIALMKDQVDNLRARGITAAAIYSGMTNQEIYLTLDNCIYGAYNSSTYPPNVWGPRPSSRRCGRWISAWSLWTSRTVSPNGDTISVPPISTSLMCVI